MKRQIKWNQYEAAILLDAYLKILTSGSSFSKIVEDTSKKLRVMAVNNGLAIDDTYRNINGITLQMYSNMLIADGVKKDDATSIINAFKRFCKLPLGTVLNFGYVEEKGRIVNTLCRTKCVIEDNRVVLYALYKFAEKCNLDKEFNVSYLYDENVERAGISPIRIFGLYDEEELKSILLGLSSVYPEFINAAFTNDLQTITLQDKTSNDVLNLFKEER